MQHHADTRYANLWSTFENILHVNPTLENKWCFDSYRNKMPLEEVKQLKDVEILVYFKLNLDLVLFWLHECCSLWSFNQTFFEVQH